MLRLIASLAVLAAAALTAPAAWGATYCVHQGTGCAPGTLDRGDDLQAAIDSAETTIADDVIQIGPGGYQGPFRHDFGGFGKLRFEGSGAGVTALYGGPGDASTIRLDGASLYDVTVIVKAANGARGVWANRSSRVRDVVVSGAAFGGGERTGILLEEKAGLLRTRVEMTGPADRAVFTDNETENRFLTEVTLRGHRGLVVEGGEQHSLLVVHSTITAAEPVVMDGGRVTMRNVLLEGAFGTGVLADCGGTDAYFKGEHVTIVGTGEGVGVRAECATAGDESDVILENSLVDRVGAPWIRTAVGGADADIHARWSNLPGEPFASGPGSANLQDVLAVPSGFAEDGRRLAPDSPLRDAGDPAFASNSEDLDGNPRVQNGRVDMGAFELAPLPDQPPATPPAGGAPTPPPAGLPSPTAAGGGKAKKVTRKQLLRELRRTVRGRRGRAYRHRWLVPGTLRIKWVARGPRVVASVRVQRSKPGTRRMKVGVAKSRRRVLAATRRVTVVASFTPRGGKAIRLKRSARLRPLRR